MTQDVDILSTRAAELAEELRAHLAKAFTIAVRVRVVADGKGFRVFQLRQPKNRHLADVRQVEALPPTQLVAEIRVAYARRQGQPKGGTDSRDLMVLLLAFPHLKDESGPVLRRLVDHGADETALAAWRQFATARIDADELEDDGD
jgi:hypothetical protein